MTLDSSSRERASAGTLAPLSRFLDPADYAALVPELAVVDAYGIAGQASEHRRWEYALALRAIGEHLTAVPTPSVMYDIGGGGSHFFQMLHATTGVWPTVVDPSLGTQDLAEFVQEQYPRLGGVVTCLSVLEHVEDLEAFCYHLACLTAPGGLLVLTMDAVGEAPDGDTFHFHWMRKRIFTREGLYNVYLRFAASFEFHLEARSDWTYPGPHVFDYSFASLVLRKHC
jgi:hypothetical protein